MISFVVPLYNHLAESQVMLYSLLESLPDDLAYEVILVDDASTDATRDWLSNLSLPNVSVFLNDKNMGFAKSSNRGAAEARGNYLCFLNNDLEFDPGWLKPMLNLFEAPDLNAGIVGNVQYRVADGQLDHAGVYLSEGGAFLHSQPKVLPQHSSDKVLAVTGACLMMRRTLFEEVGGFDTQYINGCEDLDLCYKVRAAGLNIMVCYESQIRHHVSLSRKPNLRQNDQNSAWLYAKWRKGIKHDLATVLFPMLEMRSGWEASAIPGTLSNDFLESPFTASRIIAESVLCRLEAYWARTVGDALIPSAEDIHVSTRGIERVTGATYYKILDTVVIDVVGLRSARNVYVCGFKVAAAEPKGIAVSFEFNGIQTVVQQLGAEQSMNVGVINPLWLTGVPNRIKVSFAFAGEDGVALGNACKAVLLTHVVVDDQEFHDL